MSTKWGQLAIRRVTCSVVFSMLFCIVGSAVAAPQTAPLSPQQKILQALNRMTFGPRPGDVEAVQKIGLQNWIDAQLNPQGIDDSAVDKQIADLKLLQMSQEDLMLAY
ncbi:MAG: DUF1800 family protein, partial [Abditibacteriaceae bacterium]